VVSWRKFKYSKTIGGCGTQTAGLAFGGITTVDSAAQKNIMDLVGHRLILGIQQDRFLAGAGTQTAGLGFGGNPSTATEEYDGTSWTTGGNLNIKTRFFRRSRYSNSSNCIWWFNNSYN
jgi:hypothetical protein